jgi:phosphate transport system substrate-binding protein
VELIYAVQNNILYGSVRNSAGIFLKASLEGVTAAAASAPKMPADFRVSITNAPGKDAYPISTFTWLLIPGQSKDPAKGKILADFLNWMISDGQKLTTALDYAPLPENVAAKVKETIKQVK